MNKKMIAYVIVPVLGLAILGGGITYAATNSANVPKPMTALVDALTKKFNLNSTDVQQVVSQVMTEQKAQRETDENKKFSDRIAQAVTDKKLTQAQADLIITKHNELEAARVSLEGKTPAERMAAMKAQMDVLKKWATDNNIPAGFLMFGGHHMGKGFGHHGPDTDLETNDDSTNATQTNN